MIQKLNFQNDEEKMSFHSTTATDDIPIKAKPTSLKALISWCFYDLANTSFAAIIETFVFSSYFVRSVATNPTEGMALWGFTLGTIGLVIAFLGPILGALADQSGHRKTWLFATTTLCVIATSLLWFVKPSPDYVDYALFLVSLGILGSESSTIFYNAMLPSLASPNNIGRWSGWGWSFAYFGGVFSLSLSLLVFVDPDADFFSFLNRGEEEHIRATFLLAGLWYTLFSLPLFLFTPESKGTGKSAKRAIIDGFTQIKASIHILKRYPHIFRFFIARMFYADALVTLFAFGGIYAASTFNLSEQNILLFGILMNISAGVGAAVLACFDDWLGGRKMIVMCLICLIVFSVSIAFSQTQAQFWFFGLLLGLFVGPVQASSRSYLSRVTPKSLRNQMFGFNTLSGKATSFLGPMLVGWSTYVLGNQRAGLSVIVVFFVIGLIIVWTLPNEKELYPSNQGED